MIPEAAVEAAAKAASENTSIRGMWDNATTEWKRAYRASLVAALEAAAPHLMAEAWEVGMVSMCATTGGEWSMIPEQNPYRLAKAVL